MSSFLSYFAYLGTRDEIPFYFDIPQFLKSFCFTSCSFLGYWSEASSSRIILHLEAEYLFKLVLACMGILNFQLYLINRLNFNYTKSAVFQNEIIKNSNI